MISLPVSMIVTNSKLDINPLGELFWVCLLFVCTHQKYIGILIWISQFKIIRKKVIEIQEFRICVSRNVEVLFNKYWSHMKGILCCMTSLYCLFAWENPPNPGGATNEEDNYPYKRMYTYSQVLTSIWVFKAMEEGEKKLQALPNS